MAYLRNNRNISKKNNNNSNNSSDNDDIFDEINDRYLIYDDRDHEIIFQEILDEIDNQIMTKSNDSHWFRIDINKKYALPEIMIGALRSLFDIKKLQSRYPILKYYVSSFIVHQYGISIRASKNLLE